MFFGRVDIFLELKCQENRTLKVTVISGRLDYKAKFSGT